MEQLAMQLLPMILSGELSGARSGGGFSGAGGATMAGANIGGLIGKGIGSLLGTNKRAEDSGSLPDDVLGQQYTRPRFDTSLAPTPNVMAQMLRGR